MKLLKMILDNTGKWGLSAAQTAGVLSAATVGVIGLGMMMTGSTDVNPDTAFSSSDDIVYVSSTASGAYDGVGYADDKYGEGGEVRSSINVKQSRDWQLMEQDAMKEPEKQQRDEEEAATSDLQAFAMDGAKTGLNMGDKGLVDTGNPGKGNMTAFQQQIANMQAVAEQKQKEAEAMAVAAGQVGGQGAGGESGTGVNPKGGKFNLNGSINTSGGNSFGAEGLRPTGVNGPKGGESPENVTAPEANTVDPRKPRFSWSRDMEIEAGKKYQFKGKDDVENIYLATKTNAGNVTGDYMMGATENKVGPSIGMYVSDGPRNTTSDLIDDVVNDWGNKTAAAESAYMQAQQKIIEAMDTFAKELNDGWNTWYWLRFVSWVLPGVGPMIATIVHLVKNSKRRKTCMEAVNEFKKNWVESETLGETWKNRARQFMKATTTTMNALEDYTWGAYFNSPTYKVYSYLDDKYVTVTPPRKKNRVKNLYKEIKEIVWPRAAEADEKKK